MLTKTERIKKIHDSFFILGQTSKRWFIQRLQNHGLTLPQFMALAALASHKQPCTMSDLTNVSFHDPPTMTGVIDRLVKMELVERTRSQSDRRVVLVEATPAGIELVSKIETTLTQEIAATYEALPDEYLNQLELIIGYLLRIHLKKYTAIADADIENEIEHLEKFMQDPICYIKSENGKSF